MFMAATAMATTVSTLAATAMVRGDPGAVAAAPAVTCACECPVPEREPEPEPASEPAPEVRAVPSAIVDGALDKDIVRRIVRAHIGEVRDCYNRALVEDPKAAGRVEISMLIGADGKVEHAESNASTLPASVGECIATAAMRWPFPRSSDGQTVQVMYPFVMEPG
jgi:hypothetical protein